MARGVTQGDRDNPHAKRLDARRAKSGGDQEHAVFEDQVFGSFAENALLVIQEFALSRDRRLSPRGESSHSSVIDLFHESWYIHHVVKQLL